MADGMVMVAELTESNGADVDIEQARVVAR